VAELASGLLLLASSAALGLVVACHTGPNPLDNLGFRLLPADMKLRWAVDVVQLGSTPALVLGVMGLSLVALLSGDRIRAMSCVLGPLGAALTVQFVAKPLVGRPFEGTSILTYPSGTVTTVAALAAGAFLAVPRLAKPLAGVLGLAVVAAASAAVVILRWHYATDAIGGLCLGSGVVLALDGALLSWWSRTRSVPQLT